MDRRKIIIFMTVFIDVVGLGLVLPTLPLYVEKFGASPFITTLFFAIYAFCSFFAAPILGSISDKYGRRPVLIFSLLGTAIGWFIFAIANSLPLLLIGRIIDGFTSGNISTAQSYLVDISKTPKERTANLGIIGASFGIGFMMGPALGAMLSHFGSTVPFWSAGALAMLNTVAAYFFLPETHHSPDRRKKISINPLTPIIKAFHNKKMNMYLTAWFLFCMATAVQQTIFTLYVHNVFGFNEIHAGYLMAMNGLIIVINQGILLRKFWLKRFREPSLEIISVIVISIVYAVLAIPNLIIFLIGLIIFAMTQSVLRVVTNSQIIGTAAENEKGEVIGVTQGLMSLAAIIMPPLGGIFFEIDPRLPWLTASAIMLSTLVLIIIVRKKIARAKIDTSLPPITT